MSGKCVIDACEVLNKDSLNMLAAGDHYLLAWEPIVVCIVAALLFDLDSSSTVPSKFNRVQVSISC